MDELLGRQSALQEAKALFKMIGQDGETVESLRALIAVSAKDEKVLRAYVKTNQEDAHWIERALMFRQAVLASFDALVRDGVQDTDLPEAEEAELELLEDTPAMPCQNLLDECSALA